MDRPTPPFREVFQEHWPFVWRILHYFGASGRDVEDLAQEVFMVVHRRLHDFDPTQPMQPWIAGICRRVAAAHRRKAHVRREILCESIAEQIGREDPSQQAEDRDSLRRLNEVLLTLPEDQRVVFLLHEVEQLAMSEITAILECPLQTGYSRYRAALGHIRATFEEGGGHAE